MSQPNFEQAKVDRIATALSGLLERVESSTQEDVDDLADLLAAVVDIIQGYQAGRISAEEAENAVLNHVDVTTEGSIVWEPDDSVPEDFNARLSACLDDLCAHTRHPAYGGEHIEDQDLLTGRFGRFAIRSQLAGGDGPYEPCVTEFLVDLCPSPEVASIKARAWAVWDTLEYVRESLDVAMGIGKEMDGGKDLAIRRQIQDAIRHTVGHEDAPVNQDEPLYVLTCERDGSDPQNGGRPIVFEQYLDAGAASLDSIRAFRKRLGDRYGNTRIAKLQFVKD